MGEAEVMRAIEIYREEHTTWDLEKIILVFAEDARMIMVGRPPYEGKEAIRKLFGELKSGQQKMWMKHLRVIISGNQAAVEWETTGTWADGSDIHMTGANIYEVENGKIKYLHIYRNH